MLDVVTSLRLLEHRAGTVLRKGAGDPAALVGLGVAARDLGARVGATRVPPLAEGDIREKAMLLTFHGDELARAAITGREAARIASLMREVEADTHLLRGALEAAQSDGTKE